MEFILESSDLEAYLAASAIIDFEEPSIFSLARELTWARSLPLASIDNKLELIRSTYEWVRDRISHSWDIRSNIVTCRASEVLAERQGLCFAKSHLLAALLRCSGVPTGFCYQKLVFSDDRPSFFTLHGFNAIYVEEIDRWIRLDARGNKEGVMAEFSLGEEKLAFPTRKEWGEAIFPTIYCQPDAEVVRVLQKFDNLAETIVNLPATLTATL